MKDDIKSVLISEEEINKKVSEMAKKITDKYKDKNVVLISILKGSFVFFADLIRKIEIPIEIDFMQASSYGNNTVSTEVKIIKDVDFEINGKNVIIVEDIIDSGKTLSFLKKYLYNKGAENVEICSLLVKPDRCVIPVKNDYDGFVIPDEFVVGYGLDYAEKYRNLPYIAILDEKVYNINKK